MPDLWLSLGRAIDAVFDVRFIAVGTLASGFLALWKYRGIVDGNDHSAIWGKVVPAAVSGAAASTAVVALGRLLRTYDSNFCAELSQTELAGLYSFPVLVGAVGGFVGLRRAFHHSPAAKAPSPTAEERSSRLFSSNVTEG